MEQLKHLDWMTSRKAGDRGSTLANFITGALLIYALRCAKAGVRPQAKPDELFSSKAYKKGRAGVMIFEMADGNTHGSHWAEDLFEAHAACLILYGRALGLGHSESEDSVQDVFAQLLQRPEPPRKPAHYLVRAFRNHALNRKRSLWRRLARELESRDWFEPAEDPHPAERSAMEALAKLPAEQREVIVLKFWHAMTFEEIAEVTGVGPNTAAGRFRYGMDHLRRHLKLSEDPSFFPCPTS